MNSFRWFVFTIHYPMSSSKVTHRQMGLFSGCRRPDSNRHGVSPTAPSRQRVYQFHHFGISSINLIISVLNKTCQKRDKVSTRSSAMERIITLRDQARILLGPEVRFQTAVE